MTLHYGLIGCGMMGHEHIQNIALLDDTEISVIYEPDPEMCAFALKTVPTTKIVNSLKELLDHNPLDCLVVVSPNYCHMGQLKEIAHTRPLPILCEKPLYTDPRDLIDAEDFSKNYKALAWVAMEYRYMPPVAAFIDLAKKTTGGVKMLTIREHRFPFLPKICLLYTSDAADE